MSAHKPNTERLAILERRKNVAGRYLRGQTQWEIARAFEVDQGTISRDLKAIQEEWLGQAVLDRGEWTARELARIDEVERSAWTAWSKSQENAETIKSKTRGGKGETEKTTRGQAGDPRFLDIVLKCVQRRCELLGLNAKDEEGDGDEDSQSEDSGIGALTAQVRAAVERCRGRSGGKADSGAGETPPLEPPAGSAEDGDGERS